MSKLYTSVTILVDTNVAFLGHSNCELASATSLEKKRTLYAGTYCHVCKNKDANPSSVTLGLARLKKIITVIM